MSTIEENSVSSNAYVNVRIWGDKYAAFAGTDGMVRVYDPVAGHFTTCHSLTPSQQRRVRSATRKRATA